MQATHLYVVMALLVCLSSVHGLGQTQEDSLLQLIAESKDDSLSMEWYNQLRILTVRQDLNQAMTYAHAYLSLARKQDDAYHSALGHAYIGNLFVRKADYEAAIGELLEAIAYFEAENDSTRMGSIYNSIGAAYEQLGNDSLTQQFFQKSYQIFSARGDAKRTALALNNLSNVAFRAGQFEASESLIKEALQLIREDPSLEDYYVLVSINLANTLLELEKYTEADAIYREIYAHPKARENYLQAVCLHGMGRAQLKQQQYSRALSFLTRCDSLVQAFDFNTMKGDLLQDLAEAYAGTGDAVAALEQYKLYNSFRDSVLTEEKIQALNEALQKYASEKKDQEIKNQQLRLQNMWTLFSALAILLLAGITVLYFRNRSQRNKTQLLQEQARSQALEIDGLRKENRLISLHAILEGQEEERRRIARDLHDNIGSMMSAIKLKILTIRENIAAIEKMNIGEQLDGMVSQVAEEVRRISHNMTPLAFGLSGLDGAVRDLCHLLRAEHIQVTESLSDLDRIQDTDRGIMIYRIFQELVQNILKHSGATEVDLATWEKDQVLHARVRDNGRGIPQELWENSPGLGLRSVKSRVDYLRGKILMHNEGGSTFTFQIPITP